MLTKPGSTATAAGKTRIRYGFLKILSGSDLSRRRLPLMSAASAEPGPTVWLTACVHGDEVSGMAVVQEIFKGVRKNGLLRGTLHAFPLMNPIGFETASRNITMSKEDLNRSFPGNPKGSLAERIADRIFSAIAATEPDLVIDLHCDWLKSIPYAVIDPKPQALSDEAYARTRESGERTGFLLILDTDELKRSLSYSLLQRGTPALTMELGESLVVNEVNVQHGLRSVQNLLSDLGMVEPAAERFRLAVPAAFQGELLKFHDQPVSSTSGIIRFLVKPGDVVRKGKAVARIYNAFGKLVETIHASRDGIVLGHSDSSVAFPGAPVMAFAVP